jgi:hypothetical protein
MLQSQDQSLRPLTTAHLAQTVSLLTLPNQELRDRSWPSSPPTPPSSLSRNESALPADGT